MHRGDKNGEKENTPTNGPRTPWSHTTDGGEWFSLSKWTNWISLEESNPRTKGRIEAFWRLGAPLRWHLSDWWNTCLVMQNNETAAGFITTSLHSGVRMRVQAVVLTVLVMAASLSGCLSSEGDSNHSVNEVEESPLHLNHIQVKGTNN